MGDRAWRRAHMRQQHNDQIGTKNKSLGKVILWSLAGIGVLAVIVYGLMIASKPSVSGAASVKEGMTAPAFSLPSTTGGTISLADYKGKKNVLLYFHEGITCDPCWQQIPAVEQHLKDLDALNVAYLNITVDPLDAIKKRAEPYHITTPILADTTSQISKAYDVERFSMAMPAPSGGTRPGHTFILVGIDGKIKWRKDYWDGFGMMNVPDGKMFVDPSEIVSNVKTALTSNGG